MPLEYTNEPERSTDDLIVRKDKPFNAEPKVNLLVQNYVTPDPLFFHRNHGPIPDIDIETHKIEIKGELANPLELTVKDLKTRFNKRSVMATIQVKSDLNCAGPQIGS
jgi:sulfite oxidase